jgi:rhodanese-related sulfurtransferase
MSRTSINDLLLAARARIVRYRPVAAAEALKRGAVLIDLRCEEDRSREGTVDGAIRIPRTVLEWRVDPDSPWKDTRVADTERALILMCNDGYSSSLAAATLRDLGFADTGDVEGGYRAWKQDGLPILTP